MFPPYQGLIQWGQDGYGSPSWGKVPKILEQVLSEIFLELLPSDTFSLEKG